MNLLFAERDPELRPQKDAERSLPLVVLLPFF